MRRVGTEVNTTGASQTSAQPNNPDYVRAAQMGDCPHMARIQIPNMVASLRQGTDRELPDQTFTPLTVEAVQAQWEATLSQPPTPGSRVLVAVGGGQVVGFAAMHLTDEPTSKDINWPNPAVEITALEVAQEHTQRGHGSRLLAAVTELAGQGGAQRVQVWIVAGDQRRIAFYQGAGLAPAGMRRQLQVGSAPVFEHLWWARLD